MKEYQVRIPVEVDEAHVAFRVATSAIALDVYAATPDLAVEIVTRAIEAVVASNEFGPPDAPPEACHPGAACSKREPADPKPDPHAGCKRELQRVKEARNTDLRRERDALLASNDAIVLARQKADILNAEACKAVDCASADLIPAIQRLRATVGSLRETNDRLSKCYQQATDKIATITAELEAERAKVRELDDPSFARVVLERDAMRAEVEALKAQISRDTGAALTKPMTAECYNHGICTSDVALRSLDGSERVVVKYTPGLRGALHDAVVEATWNRTRFVLAPEHQDVTAARERAEKAEALAVSLGDEVATMTRRLRDSESIGRMKSESIAEIAGVVKRHAGTAT